MKKKFSLLLLCLCLCAGLFACNKEVENKPLAKNQPYSFQYSACIVNENLTLEDLRQYIPTNMHIGNITTVDEFKQMILNNLDRYNIVESIEGGYHTVYFYNVIESIEFSDTVCTFVNVEQDTFEFPYTVNENVYTVEEMPYPLVYENNFLYYDIKCKDAFVVRHYFSL